MNEHISDTELKGLFKGTGVPKSLWRATPVPDDVLEHYRVHQKTHKIVRDTLKEVAKDIGISPRQAEKLLPEQNVDVTVLFWKKTRAKHGDKYEHVWYCPSCQKFSLT